MGNNVAIIGCDVNHASDSREDLRAGGVMIIVYIAGPYRAKTTWGIECNIHRARRVGAEVAQAGGMPLIPHGNTEHFDGLQPDAFWLEGTLELLRRSDAVVLVDGWRESSGSRAEVLEAHKLGLPVFENAEAFRGWMNDMGDMALIGWPRGRKL